MDAPCHRAGEAVDGGLLAEHRLEVCVRERGRVERTEALADHLRSRKRLLHRHLLVEDEADEQRERVGRDECVRVVVVGEVEAIGHGAIVRCAAMWVFGYGSLASLPGAQPAVLEGHERSWGVAMDNTVELPGYKVYEDADGTGPRLRRFPRRAPGRRCARQRRAHRGRRRGVGRPRPPRAQLRAFRDRARRLRVPRPRGAPCHGGTRTRGRAAGRPARVLRASSAPRSARSRSPTARSSTSCINLHLRSICGG